MFVPLNERKTLSRTQVGRNFLAVAPRAWPLGGSKVIGVDDGASLTLEFVDGMGLTLDGDLLSGFLARMRVELKNEAGGSCTPQLWNETTGAAAGIGVASSATTFDRQSFAVTLAPGSNVYVARLVRSSAVLNAWAIGYLEINPSTRVADQEPS